MASQTASAVPGQAGPAPAQREAPRYKILGRIASGGMGSVYLGAPSGDPRPTSLVAIKVIHENLAENRVFVDMLLDEARLASRIHHTNVVGITDVGTFGNRHFVVMPYIEGGTLSELVHRSTGHLPIGLVARVISEALDGLHAAHCLVDEQGRSLGLVHRDVSPGNILIGVDGIARVIDFGIAKAATRITQTAPGTVKGKFSYMAPEQAMGDQVDRRADVFSAGVVLWSMLTGKRLFTGKNSAQTIRNLMNTEIVPPSQVRGKIPRVFDDVCLRALQRSPYKRYQDAADMAKALRIAAQEAGCLVTPAEVGRIVAEAFTDRVQQRRKIIEQSRRTSRSITVDQPGFERHVADLEDRPSGEGVTPATPSGRVTGSSAAAPDQDHPGPAPSLDSDGRPSETLTVKAEMSMRAQSPGLAPAEAAPSAVMETLSGRLVRLTREEVVAQPKPRRRGKYVLLAVLLACAGLGVAMRAELQRLLAAVLAPAASTPAATAPTVIEPVRIAVDPPAPPAETGDDPAGAGPAGALPAEPAGAAAGAADAGAAGAETAQPGAETAQPGATAAEPGAATAQPGAETAEPGAETAEPGAETAEPGAATAQPAGTAEPGAATAQPAAPAAPAEATGAAPQDPVHPSSKPERSRKRPSRREVRPRPAPQPTLDLGD
jgi:serine/threonine-protein kinase